MPFKCEAGPCEWRLRRFGHASVSDFTFQAFVPINFESEYADADDGSNSASNKNPYSDKVGFLGLRDTDLVYSRQKGNCATQNTAYSGEPESADNARFMICQHIELAIHNHVPLYVLRCGNFGRRHGN